MDGMGIAGQENGVSNPFPTLKLKVPFREVPSTTPLSNLLGRGTNYGSNGSNVTVLGYTPDILIQPNPSVPSTLLEGV